MADPLSRWSIPTAALLPLFLLALPAPLSAQRPDVPVPAAWREDALLWDVEFVDALRGWAVGDRGAIWHTEDGGQTWALQESGVNCPLRSVCFLDATRGWAVGGCWLPFDSGSRGVLLRTEDGGRKWTLETRLPLPGLRQVEFFSPALGYALCEPSGMHASGVLLTDDGGRSWDPLPGATLHGWQTADFLDPGNGALAARNGALAAVNRGLLGGANAPSSGLRRPRQLRLSLDGHGWLVGEGGLILGSDDAGANWHPVAERLPAWCDGFDWHTVEVRGPHCWIAGSPGSVVVHSGDGGRSWQPQATGQPLPIHSLSFLDDTHGWAVGAFGTVLATDDGGASWRRLRGGGTQAAVLGFYAEPADVPLELLARLSANDGLLSVVGLIARRDLDLDLPSQAETPDRGHEALVASGAGYVSSAWQFPLRQRGIPFSAERIVAGWDRANAGSGLDLLEEHLVRQIRLWRPEVVLVPGTPARDTHPESTLIDEAVLSAVDKAANAAIFPRQIEREGLAIWRVKKVYAALPDGEPGTAEITTAQLAPFLGRSLADHVALPRTLVERNLDPPPATLGFQLLANALPQNAGEGDFASGLTLETGVARRDNGAPPAQSLEWLSRTAQKNRNAQAILARAGGGSAAGAQLAAQVEDLLGGLPPSEAGCLLFQLAERYYRSGQWTLAAETYGLVAGRYPDHPLAAPAMMWLAQYWSSGEAGWRAERGQAQAVAETLEELAGSPRLAKASTLGAYLEQHHPLLHGDPRIRFPLAAADRGLGQARQAERFYLSQLRGRPRDAWRACAEGESWLSLPQAEGPKPAIRCTLATAHPYLDGKLHDEVWQRARPIALLSALLDDAGWPAVARLAYDDEFVYLAVECRRAEGVEYLSGDSPRPRDPNLAKHDRVDFFLDLDRDGATCYRLTVDHRGWTGEDCWGDASWDPQWFVASGGDERSWTAEAAIPLEELCGLRPGGQTVWSLGVQRVVPGAGLQSWTAPATVEPLPAAFGYLMFESPLVGQVDTSPQR